MAAVAGIDRWRKGWVLAIIDDARVELSSQALITDTMEQVSNCEAVAIDMPMALVECGQREAERELRTLLGSAGRSVFYSPSRSAIQAENQTEATILNRASGGPGISAQAWGLAASIREVRAALGPFGGRTRWWETHPESAFATMNGGAPLCSKRSARGVAVRLGLLRNHFPAIDATLLDAPNQVPIDDVLDAVAAAWSAARIASGTANVVGAAGRDDQGFPLGVRI